jgi:hypothetical protein
MAEGQSPIAISLFSSNEISDDFRGYYDQYRQYQEETGQPAKTIEEFHTEWLEEYNAYLYQQDQTWQSTTNRVNTVIVANMEGVPQPIPVDAGKLGREVYDDIALQIPRETIGAFIQAFPILNPYHATLNLSFQEQEALRLESSEEVEQAGGWIPYIKDKIRAWKESGANIGDIFRSQVPSDYQLDPGISIGQTLPGQRSPSDLMAEMWGQTTEAQKAQIEILYVAETQFKDSTILAANGKIEDATDLMLLISGGVAPDMWRFSWILSEDGPARQEAA